MSKLSTASATKNPTPQPKGAWSRGPPQPAIAPTPRSQSPAPPATPIQTHSRRPSALGQSVSIKDGVSVPRSNVGAVKQSPAVTFGSIDGAEAPISSSPATAPPIKSEGVKSFGSVPATTSGHVNGKASISSRTSVVPQSAQAAQSTSSSSSTLVSKSAADGAATPPTPAPTAKPKIDIKKMFQNPSSAPSSNPPSDTSSPAMRNISLPGQNQSSSGASSGPSGPSGSASQSSSSHPSSQLAAHSYTSFVPRPQGGNPQNGAGPPPRSPSYNRSMQNGNGPRNQGGPAGQNPSGNPAMSSPRLNPPPHNGVGQPGGPAGMPPPTPQMQPHMQPGMPMWPGYYYAPPEQQQYMYGWYGHMPMPPNPHAQHQPPPGQHSPMPPVQVHPGMPMSPRNPPSSLQNPGTPTLSHAHAVPTNPTGVMPSPHMQHAHPHPHGPPHPHSHPHPPHGPSVPAPSPLTHPSTSLGGLTSPPPTPSSVPSSIPPVSAAASPITGPNRLSASSSTFVPRKITVKNQDGVEVDLGIMKGPASANSVQGTGSAAPPPSTPSYRQGSPGTSNRRPTSIRIESEDQRKARLAEEERKIEAERKKKEDEERKIKEVEEKKRKEKEDAEKKVREAEEKKRRDEEEKKRKEIEEKERKKREEEEKERKKAEAAAEAKRKEEEAKQRKIEEEARRVAEEKKRKEEEEEARRVAEEKKRQELEEEKKRQEEEEAKAKAEAEEKARKEKEEVEAKAAADAAKAKADAEKEEGEIVEDGKDVVPPSQASADAKDKAKEALRINTSNVSSVVSPTIDRRRHPGPLDLTDAKKSNIPAPQSALATARIISDISSVQYPEGVSSPRPDLNKDAKEGKFRYDRDFLLQFMQICKEKPASLPPLDAIGLEPVDPSSLSMQRGGSGRHRTSSAATLPPSRQASIGLGFSPSTLGKGAPGGFNAMGQFTSVGASKLSSEERFRAASATSGPGGPGMPFPRPHAIVRTASTGGAGAPRERTRSKRGEKRNEGNRVQGGQHNSAFGNNNYQNSQQQMNLEPVAPLQASANRWDRKHIQVESDSPEMVDRKVKGLLNKLTMEKFDSISDQIIAWANKSEKEGDGRTLIQVIKLVFEKATDEATWSEMYARLCRKMMEQISPKVQDEGIKNNEGKPIAGGQLFRKYLLNRCQEDFESGWKAKEATAKAAASKAKEDEAVKAENDKSGDSKEEVALYSEEYYAAQKAKRQGLGLIKFIGELFKLQMLTERIMHECVKKLLGNVDNPEEEEIESLCKLLTTVGYSLDTQKARAHMDVYFSRMKELTKSPHVNSRMQFMLQDIIELRERKWSSRQGQSVAAPTTLAQIHEADAKEKAAKEKESYQRQMSMSRGGSRRGGDRSDYPQVGPDGWAVAGGGPPPPRQPPKAGDLSQFGKITKGQGPMTFGPSSVFAGKKGPVAENKRESISRTASSSNMFSMLEAAEKPESQQRRRLVLQPRSKPVESETAEASSPAAESDGEEEEAAAAPEMSEKDVSKKLDEDIKEFFSVKSMDEGYFTDIPAKLRFKLVENFTCAVLEKKEADARLLAQFFTHAVSKGACSPETFEDGFIRVAEIVFDVAIDAPKALDYFAIAVKGADLPENIRSNIASKSEDPDKLLSLFS